MSAASVENQAKADRTGPDANTTKPKAAAAVPPGARAVYYGGFPYPIPFGRAPARGGSRGGVYFWPQSVWDMMPRGAPPVWLAGGPEFNGAEPGSYVGAESGASGPEHRGSNGTEPAAAHGRVRPPAVLELQRARRPRLRWPPPPMYNYGPCGPGGSCGQGGFFPTWC
ncbi:hypothetical protein H9P43_002731 [Blastocladiella emersonii ATCC 22665]|nr:hypothetical protein H9P43_002731 [Blastocladiella emersonii ATCC 22665]